jgi:hypothetical protein
MARKTSRRQPPVRRRVNSEVTRFDFNRLKSLVEDCHKTLSVQFTRIAQIQAELDEVRLAWNKTRPPRGR